MGLLLLDVGRYDEAKRWIDKAEQRRPSDEVTMQAKVFHRYLTGTLDPGVLDDVAFGPVDQPFVFANRGLAAALLGDFPRAVSNYERVSESQRPVVFGNPWWIMTGLTQAPYVALAYKETGRQAEADEILRALLARIEKLGLKAEPVYLTHLKARIAGLSGDAGQENALLSAALESGCARWGKPCE